VSVPLELEDELMFELMKMAHEQDITLNEMVEQLLRRVIDEKTIRGEFNELFDID
jgi:predicted HicB family RNase H-like nuclease